jgi:hypothetical protein
VSIGHQATQELKANQRMHGEHRPLACGSRRPAANETPTHVRAVFRLLREKGHFVEAVRRVAERNRPAACSPPPLTTPT